MKRIKSVSAIIVVVPGFFQSSTLRWELIASHFCSFLLRAHYAVSLREDSSRDLCAVTCVRVCESLLQKRRQKKMHHNNGVLRMCHQVVAQ